MASYSIQDDLTDGSKRIIVASATGEQILEIHKYNDDEVLEIFIAGLNALGHDLFDNNNLTYLTKD